MSVVGIFVDTPLCFALKIVWVVMFVLGLDCLRGVLAAAFAATGASGDVHMFSVMAPTKGALVWGLNLALMPAIVVVHTLLGTCIKLEKDHDVMERQAEHQPVFAKTFIDENSGMPAPETKTPEEEEPTREMVWRSASEAVGRSVHCSFGTRGG